MDTHYSFQQDGYRIHIYWQKEPAWVTVYCDMKEIRSMPHLNMFQTTEQLMEIIRKWIPK